MGFSISVIYSGIPYSNCSGVERHCGVDAAPSNYVMTAYL